MDLKLPQGFKFDPSDKQLLEDYLKPKIQGTLSWDVIKEKEIYGPNANPWEIFNDSSTQWITSGSQKSVYVFARLTKMADKESSGNEVHYVRKAGCGTWHVETGRRFVMDGNNLIGEKRMLVFQINDVSGLKDGGNYYWKMHEYFLKGREDYVVCRITFDTLKAAKVSTKDVSGTRASTRSKANKKIATTRTTKEVASVHDSGIVNYIVGGGDTSTYENQRCHEENSLCRDGSDQRSILDQDMPQYDDAGGSSDVAEPGVQGLKVLNHDQRLNSEEAAQPVMGTGEGFQNLGTVLSDINGGSHDQVYVDMEDLFGGDFWSNIDNLLMMEPPMPNNIDVSLDFQNMFDAGSWSDKNLEELGRVNNNVQEQQQQQPTQNMSCMLGKRQSFEAQEAGPTKKCCI